ncbi:MAG: S-adenosylmethionine:tRNA ribosyltransferase-isomerase [Gemmatimonadales bacterium]
MTTLEAGIEFDLPDELSAHEPPEARGLSRDGVRLMVSRVNDDRIIHSRFANLPELLAPNDVLVVNASATLNAAFNAIREAGDASARNIMLHLSTPLSEGRWVVELRRHSEKGTSPMLDAQAGERIGLPAGATARLVEPYAHDEFSIAGVRLWIAELTLPGDALFYSVQHGAPIRYAYVPSQWPLPYYQTIFSKEPGSAEMPSAGRPFTREIVERLTSNGVRVAPLILHTGVSSVESDEPPYPERYRVPDATAYAVNRARSTGGRVIAVGTTVVRALETVASQNGTVRAGGGWTDLVITPERGFHAVNAMLTGFHAPKASHLSMLEALAGRDHLAFAYESALRERYLWHEFGDLHLILP